MLRYALFVVVLCVSGAVEGRPSALLGQDDANQIVDGLIKEMVGNVPAGGLHIPVLNKTFDTTIDGIHVTGDLEFSQGVFAGLDTLRRDGDAVITQNSTSLALKVAITLDKLGIFDEAFKVKLWGIHESGGMNASVGEIEADIAISANINSTGNCTTQVDHIGFTRLDQFKVSIMPRGIINNIRSRIATFALNHFSPKILQSINTGLQKLADLVKQDVDVCQYIMHS